MKRQKRLMGLVILGIAILTLIFGSCSSKHKYKIGDKICVMGISGEITFLTMGGNYQFTYISDIGKIERIIVSENEIIQCTQNLPNRNIEPPKQSNL